MPATLESALKRAKQNQATEEDLQQLTAFIQHAIQALEAAHLFNGYQQWAQETLLLMEAATAISAHHDINQIAQITVEYMTRLMGAESCALSKWDRNEDALTLWAEYAPPDWEITPEWFQPYKLDDYPLTRKVLLERQVIQSWVDDPNLDAAERQFMQAADIKTLVMLPLLSMDETIGLVEVMDSRTECTYHEQQITLAQLLSKHAGVAIERAELYWAQEQRAAELEAVRRASLSLTASLDLQQVLDAILESSLQLLSDAQDAHIFLYEDDSLKFGAALWSDGRKGELWSPPRPEGLTYTVARLGELILVEDMRNHPLFKGTPPHWVGSIVGQPLKISDRVVGVMTVAHLKPNGFSENDLRVLRLLGDQAAIAIENARLHDLVNQQARTDALTGLPNRRALDERLEEEVRRSKRYQRTFTLIMIDLDRFKRINDQYGHPTGDIALQQISDCLRSSIRDTDFLARYGGDEFALLLPETDIETAAHLGDRLQQSVASYHLDLPGTENLCVGASLGLANFPLHGTSIPDLISVADQDLYREKKDFSTENNN